MGKFNEAVYMYDRALEINPDLSEIYLNKCNILF